MSGLPSETLTFCTRPLRWSLEKRPQRYLEASGLTECRDVTVIQHLVTSGARDMWSWWYSRELLASTLVPKGRLPLRALKPHVHKGVQDPEISETPGPVLVILTQDADEPVVSDPPSTLPSTPSTVAAVRGDQAISSSNTQTWCGPSRYRRNRHERRLREQLHVSLAKRRHAPSAA